MTARSTRRSLLLAAIVIAGGCDARSLVPDAGTTRPPDDIDHGQWYDPLLSDFEDPTSARIVAQQPPQRNGYWYTENDGTPTCAQVPAPDAHPYVPEVPPTPSPWWSGGLALHAVWSGCAAWGAAVRAELNAPMVAGGIYGGDNSKIACDLTPFVGVSFWVMAAPGTDGQLRLELPMTGDTRYEDGGICNEASIGAGKCGDYHGEVFSVPADGTWNHVTVRFADAEFRQEGWGYPFTWSSGAAISIRIRSADAGAAYDFWIDDVYLVA